MAGQDPLLSAHVRVQYCEWLLTCRGSILPCNGDNLGHLSQALLSLSTYSPPGTPQKVTPQASKHSSQSSRGARGSSARAGAPGRKVSAACVVGHAEAIIHGVQGARRLDEAIRVCLLWSILAKGSVNRLQWLLHAARCAAKMAAAAFDTMLTDDEKAEPACTNVQQGNDQGDNEVDTSLAEASAGGAVETANTDKVAAFAAPRSLRDWLLFSMSAAQLQKVLDATAQCQVLQSSAENGSSEHKGAQYSPGRPARQGLKTSEGSGVSRDSFTTEAIHSVDRTYTWLTRLKEELQQHACVAHCLPVMWLQVLLCAQTSGRCGACVVISELSNWLQQLGLSHQAESCQILVGACLVGMLVLVPPLAS